jgi:AraC-like DNA-binding protein
VVALIRNGNYAVAKQDFNNLIDSYIPANIYSLTMARYRVFALINQLVLAFEELRDEISEDFYRELNMVDYFLEFHDIMKFKVKFDELIDRISYYSIHNQQGEKDQRDVRKIQEFINKKYMDSSLSAGLISDEYKINPTSLLRYFKKYTGEGILDYIHKVRITKAEELLCNTQLTIKEISTKVGYNSSLTMIRAFKRYRNCTPGKYRDNLHE